MIAPPAINPVLLALALSLAANGVLGWAWLGQRDDTTAAISQRADRTLGLQPKVPGDMCASMQALGDEWLQGRAQK